MAMKKYKDGAFVQNKISEGFKNKIELFHKYSSVFESFFRYTGVENELYTVLLFIKTRFL